MPGIWLAHDSRDRLTLCRARCGCLQVREAAKVLGDTVYTQFPFHEGAQPVEAENEVELALNRTWRPQLAVTVRNTLFLAFEELKSASKQTLSRGREQQASRPFREPATCCGPSRL